MQGWVCSACADVVIGFQGDIFEDYIGIRHVKLGLVPYGLSPQGRTRLKSLAERFLWCPEMEVLFKIGSKKFGDRIVPQKHERKALIQVIHRLGHVGMNRVYTAIVTSYSWEECRKKSER